jgi:hypothetical protein
MIRIFVLIIAQWSHSFQTRLGPRPGSRFWQGYRVARINSFLLNQNNVVLVKKKKQKSTGSPGHAGFFLFLFFFNSAWLQFRVPGRPAGLGRVSKLWMEQCIYIYIYIYICIYIYIYDIFSHTNKRRNKNKAYMQ